MENKRTTVYFPEHLHNKIKKISENEERSFNKQVIILIRKAIETTLPNKKQERRED